MLVSNALIGLPEGLEAALVVVILIAFLVKPDCRWPAPGLSNAVVAMISKAGTTGTELSSS